MNGSRGARTGLELDREPVDGRPRPFTLVTVDLPIREFVLEDTLLELPSVAFACESACGPSTMPLVRATGAGRTELERAFARDPSVERASIVERRGDGLTCYLEWTDRERVRFDILASGAAVFRDVRGSVDGWSFEILYPSRDDLSDAYSVWDDCNVDVDLRSIRDVDRSADGGFGLTTQQRDALAAAHEAGYFEVPREADLDEVAADLGITHQSLSERLRRAHDALIEGTVLERDR